MDPLKSAIARLTAIGIKRPIHRDVWKIMQAKTIL
jgi:hypothetical protein